jgi:hypothetical protein
MCHLTIGVIAGGGNLPVHDLAVKVVRNEDSLAPQVFVRPHPVSRPVPLQAADIAPDCGTRPA